MKKIILMCILLVGIGIGANGQSTSFGLKLNGNLTNLKLTKLKDKNNNFDPGIALGGFMKIEFGQNFALQPELLMNYSEGKIKIGNEKLKYEYCSVEVPIYGLGQFEINYGKLFFGMGPVIGYGFDSDDAELKIGNSDWDWDDYFDFKNKKNSDSDKKVGLNLNHWYMGGGLLVGYEHKSGLMAHAGYQMAYDLGSKSRKKTKIDTQTISLGVGYKF